MRWGENMKKWLPLVVVAVVILIPALMGLGTYNTMVGKQEAAKTAWSQVENQYQRRFDLIPNLVETVKGYAKQEREVLTEVTRLRSQWGEARASGNIGKAQEAARGVDGVLSRLLLVVEQYPQLKSNENFLRLQDQLEGTENRISVERRRYNLAVQDYNVQIRTFPASLIASMFGFARMSLFEAETGAQKAPKVGF
jgi:LemA protein